MANILYPAPLKVGSKIAICSLSSGLKEKYHARLDIVINGLKQRGYDLVEGEFLRQNKPREQLNAKAHAQQLMVFLLDDEIDAIMPPMGGELAMEILPLLDFNAIKEAKPKWLVGFSDVSTIACALTAKCQWAILHSANLMQLHPDEKNPYSLQIFETLTYEAGSKFEQGPSYLYQKNKPDYAQNPNELLSPSEPTNWQCLNYTDKRTIEMSGRLFGGCLDTVGLLLDSPFLALHEFKKHSAPEGLILYLENSELTPTTVARFLLSLKLAGIFDDINGLILGRSEITQSHYDAFDYRHALDIALGGCLFPVIIDADIGHVPPNLNLVNGATCTITAEINEGKVIKASLNTELC
ncbi:LD-carboxypeptidase [Pseudoalteromonas fuliginea]|uniref:LD-carboxypeptidase n=1 Tax=Pseudoalteromonas fuliginea TaxID=1872678 RepID=A0AB73BHU0_9GAMM|nr:S66 peptidase family protein [Pseudoalteromonas fuliginea]KAA1161029.1 LD-carboxypeptidase [Pseudoalteromonas fuliginea]